MAPKKKTKIRDLTAEEEAEIQRQIADDPDNPELTDEQLKSAKPFREVFPELMPPTGAKRKG